jgi:serine/threonine protein kinase
LSNQDNEAQLCEVEILQSLNPTSFKNSPRESYRRVVIAYALGEEDGDFDNDDNDCEFGHRSNGIINLIDFYPTHTHYPIVMELVHGGDVFDWFAER